MATTVLNPENVCKAYVESLALHERVEGAIVVEGIVHGSAFDPEKLERHRQIVIDMLMQLPRRFRLNEGGGWSFLNACMNEDGEQWTGEHWIMDLLFQLGMALDLVTCQLPRDMWVHLPGGMPYYVINYPEASIKREPTDGGE